MKNIISFIKFVSAACINMAFFKTLTINQQQFLSDVNYITLLHYKIYSIEACVFLSKYTKNKFSRTYIHFIQSASNIKLL